MSKLVRPLSAICSLGLLLAAAGASSPAGADTAHTQPGPGPWLSISAMSGGSADDVWGVGSNAIVNYWHALTEHWNGTRWQRVPTPDSDFVALTGVSETAQDDVWAVGTRGPSPVHPYIVHWDGSSWSVVPGAPRLQEGFLNAVAALSPDDVWAVGRMGTEVQGLIEHWNGQKWSLVRTPPPGQETSPVWIRGLGFSSPTDGWAVGTGDEGTSSASLHWDGSRWRNVAMPPVKKASYGSVAALSPTDAWTVGVQSRGYHNNDLPITAHWDGSAWTSVPFPQERDGDLKSVVALGPTDVWAFGDYLAGQDPKLRLPLVGHWDGSGWTLSSVPRGKQAKTYLFGATAIGPDDIWTGGTAGKSVFFRHWDGSGWS